jgi:hypothetical protein
VSGRWFGHGRCLVELNRLAWRSYLAALAYSGGHRLAGMRLHADLVLQEHHWRSLRSIVMGVAPDRVRQARARRWVPVPPSAELDAEAREWLAPYVDAPTD